MKNRNQNNTSFVDYAVSRRKRSNDFLDRVNELVDWRPIAKFLEKKLQRKANAVGNPSYPALVMFKILLLQRWYALSDPATEQALWDRLSFVRFVGFSLTQDIPDETTICRFRNGLVKLGVFEELLNMLNAQFEAKALLVREGAIVDASIIESARRPRKAVEVVACDRQEDEGQNEHEEVKVTYSDDEDAAWLCKGKKTVYGYKMHVVTDATDGFVLGGHITPANKSDTGEFARLVDASGIGEGGVVFADKGYTSQNNRDVLQEKKLVDGIMFKAARNKPLVEFQKVANKQISIFRFRVEQYFGTAKRKYELWRARYIGTEKVNAELFLTSMAFNIQKAVRMIKA